MTTPLCATEPVGRMVARNPSLASTLESLKIDYCCGGGKSLAEACSDLGLNKADVLNRLEDVLRRDTETEDATNWLDQSPADLCDHIESTHHAFLRAELPRLQELIAKVVAVHGQGHSELGEVQVVFQELCDELHPHMMKEEQVLFPAIRRMEAAGRALQFPFGSVGNPIHCMEHEHQAAGDALARLRGLTSNYTAPADACTSYRAMLDGLSHLERDLHQHIHKENNILFPRAMQMESSDAPPG